MKPETFELGVTFLEKEIKRTAAMRSNILILHPVSHVGEGTEVGIRQTIKGLNQVIGMDQIPKILETPWISEEGGNGKKTLPPYKEEIAMLLKE